MFFIAKHALRGLDSHHISPFMNAALWACLARPSSFLEETIGLETFAIDYIERRVLRQEIC